MKISDIMTKDVVCVGADESIQKTISLMETYNVKEVPVLEEDKVVGMVRFEDIINIVKGSPNIKVKNRMMQPPSLQANADISQATDMILNTGIEAIPVLDSKGKILGIVSDYDIIRQEVGNNVFNQPIGRVMRSETPTCSENSTIGDVRKIMEFNKIDRVPVVDENTRFLGMVLQIDLLRKFYMQQDTGGQMDLRGGFESIMSFPVKGMMRSIDKKIRLTDKISDALILMLSENLKGLIILNHEDRPAGVLLRRDILSLLSEEGKEGIVITISGAKLEDFENQKVMSLVSDKMGRIYKMDRRIREIKIYLKEVHGSEESKGKYEININLIGSKKPVQTQGIGFDPALVIDELLDNIERMLKE
jgi:CBS domain-containing protein